MFDAVARASSFSGVAAGLGMSAAYVTKRIRLLIVHSVYPLKMDGIDCSGSARNRVGAISSKLVANAKNAPDTTPGNILRGFA